MCGYRGACISKDDWPKSRGFNKSIKTKTKQNKTNVTPEKDAMASANQTPGGWKFAPLVASQQGRANQHEPACFGLSSPWSIPSRSAICLHAVVQPWLPLQRLILPWNDPPLIPPFCAILPRPGLQLITGRRWCRKFWGRPGNTPSTLFPGPQHSPRPPPILRTPRTSGVSYPPCAPQILQTRSASCVKSPRCSHFPSRSACPDSKSGGRRDCAFANRCSESGTCGGLGAACRSSSRAGSTWRSRTASSRVPRLLASGFWSRGERSVDRTVRRFTFGSCTMHCVCAGRPRCIGRHCGWRSPRGIETRSSGYTPGPLPLRWIWRWTPASPSRVNTWSQSWPPIRLHQTPRTRPRSPPSFSSASWVIVRRPRQRQHKACPKAASPELTLRQLLPPAPPAPPPLFSSSGVPKRPWCLCPPRNARRPYL